jgi:hypothetical protein
MIIIIVILLASLVIALATFYYLSVRDVPKSTIGLFMGFANSRIGQRDYRNSRGFKHLQNLRRIQQNLDTLNNKQSETISYARDQLAAIERQEDAEKYRHYCDIMVGRLEKEVPHIGPTSASNIRGICYHGRLEDLRNAQYRVHGIGEQRQYQINVWIQNKINNYPSYLDANPSISTLIRQQHVVSIKGHENAITVAKQNQINIKKNLDIVKNGILELTAVNEMDFQAAKLTKNRIVPMKLINGIYAPWETEPIWYTNLTNKYGG